MCIRRMLSQWDGSPRKFPRKWRGGLSLQAPRVSRLQAAGDLTNSIFYAAANAEADKKSRAKKALPPRAGMSHEILTTEQCEMVWQALKQQEQECLDVVFGSADLGADSSGGDEADKASATEAGEARQLNLARARRKLADVQAAMDRFATADYGYCEETGEFIGFERLLVVPTAILSVEAQSRKEKLTRQRGW